MKEMYITVMDDAGDVQSLMYVSKISYVNFVGRNARIVMDNGHMNTLTDVDADKKAYLLRILKGNTDAST